MFILDTLVSSSFTTAVAQAVQLPDISGKANNMMLFSYSRKRRKHLKDFIGTIPLIKTQKFNIGILTTTERFFGLNREILIWMNPADLNNENLMILLGYIIKGHRTWRNAKLQINAIYPIAKIKERLEE